MYIKICANTNLADAQLAAELGADAVGFVFAESKRKVTVPQVAAITAHLPSTVEKVGVFTTTSAELILRDAGAAGLTAVQLHSAFDPALVESVVQGSHERLEVLQVVDVPAKADAATLRAVLTAVLKHPYVTAALLDASHGGVSGGTGKAFDWEKTASVVREVAEATAGRVIIAGGLTLENVAEAIRQFAPWGVDVASGVESTPGVKDPAKLRQFIEAVHGAR